MQGGGKGDEWGFKHNWTYIHSLKLYKDNK